MDSRLHGNDGLSGGKPPELERYLRLLVAGGRWFNVFFGGLRPGRSGPVCRRSAITAGVLPVAVCPVPAGAVG